LAKILIVDDDPTILRLLGSIFSSAGHQTVPMQHAPLVMDYLHRTEVDAVVLDIIMPEVDGWELLTRIRARPELGNLPVVLLSSLKKVSDKVRGIRGGASDYLVKPCDPDELIARVERLIERRFRETEDLQGQLSAYSVEELCQGFEQYNKTGYLGVSGKGGSGTLEVVDGQLVSARFGPLVGELAMESMLELDEGIFHFQSKERLEVPAGVEPMVISSLMMNAAWLEDELHIRKKILPGREDHLRLLIDEPPIGDKFEDLPFDDLRDILRKQPEVPARQIRASMISSPHRLELALAVLIEQEMVAVVEAPAPRARDLATFVDDLARDQSGILRIYVLLDPSSREAFPGMLDSAGLAIGPEEQPLLTEDTGLLHTERNGRNILLFFESLSDDGYPEQMAQFSFHGCVMILARRLSRPKLYRLIAVFKPLVNKKRNLLVIPGGEQVTRDLEKVAPGICLGIWR